MAEPSKRNVQFTNSPHFLDHGMRRWREPAERKERDNRPGHYSITGAFIELPDVSETNPDQNRD
jgi:hypothetical protein